MTSGAKDESGADDLGLVLTRYDSRATRYGRDELPAGLQERRIETLKSRERQSGSCSSVRDRDFRSEGLRPTRALRCSWPPSSWRSETKPSGAKDELGVGG